MYLLVAPVAAVMAAYAPGDVYGSFVAETALFHGMVCMLVLLLIHVATVLCGMFSLARPWRVRMNVFLEVFAVWPLFVTLGMAILIAVFGPPR